MPQRANKYLRKTKNQNAQSEVLNLFKVKNKDGKLNFHYQLRL